MNKVINSKTVFCNYHKISLSDGITHDGLELSIRNMENPKEYVSVPLDKETIKSLVKMFKEAEFYEDVKTTMTYFVSCDVTEENFGYNGTAWFKNNDDRAIRLKD